MACVLFVDANVLLDQPDLARWRTDRPDRTIIILERIAREIQGLGRRGDASAAQARRAALALEAYRQRGLGAAVGRGRPTFRLQRGADLSPTVDAHLVAEAEAYRQRRPGDAVAVLTRDHGVWELAAHSGVYCVLLHGAFDNAALSRAVKETLAAHGT